MAEKGHPFPDASGSVVRPLRPEVLASVGTHMVEAQNSASAAGGARAEGSDGERGSNMGLTMFKDQLVGHKGKLAIGVAAMLGAAIYYKWREAQLARVEPQEYARLQRLKDKIRERELHLTREADDDFLRSEESVD
jgi:hypothetical protein